MRYLDHDPSFSVQAQIQRQIELEDWVNWARRDIEYPLSMIISKKMELSVTAAYMFGLGIYKRGMSIMTP